MKDRLVGGLLKFIHTHKIYMCSDKRVFVLENTGLVFKLQKYTCVLTKLFFEFIVKNIDISSYMCSRSYPCTLSFKSVGPKAISPKF